jgi:PhnB protein
MNLHVHHRNVDKLWQQAVAAGARVVMPLDDQFWGDRYGKLTDPFGHSWALSYKAKMTKEEMARKQQEAMAAFAAGAQP